tara:strand:+ start:1639 stop:2379 length:741 start_codon:yes stop_codon:yes gene_type:complete
MKKLKLAVILNSSSYIDSWISKILKKINSSNHFEIVYFFINKSIRKKNKLINRILFFLIMKFENLFFQENKISKSNFLINKKKIFILKGKKRGNYFIPYNLKKIKYLDCIINLSDKLIKGKILLLSKHGVWGLHHSDNDFQRGGLGGFYEIIYNEKFSGITLQKYSQKIDGGKIIDKIYFKTKKNYINNHNQLLKKSCNFLLRNLKKLRKNKIQYKNSKKYTKKIYGYPNFFELNAYMVKLVKNLI